MNESITALYDEDVLHGDELFRCFSLFHFIPLPSGSQPYVSASLLASSLSSTLTDEGIIPLLTSAKRSANSVDGKKHWKWIEGGKYSKSLWVANMFASHQIAKGFAAALMLIP